ncbi:MAG TPA: hypothetical protein VEZ89_06965 [Rubrivivax sp.]|nr:hypothetical protein [Rubrivivax sp.]
MSGVDLVGYLAAGLVLGTFCVRDMLTLRSTAVASNLAFITYGLLSDIGPVLGLHLLLLPINLMHLLCAARRHKPTAARGPSPARNDVTGHRPNRCLNCNPEQAHHD